MSHVLMCMVLASPRSRIFFKLRIIRNYCFVLIFGNEPSSEKEHYSSACPCQRMQISFSVLVSRDVTRCGHRSSLWSYIVLKLSIGLEFLTSRRWAIIKTFCDQCLVSVPLSEKPVAFVLLVVGLHVLAENFSFHSFAAFDPSLF